jgi:glycosyltransferase involved in cell wall biosynthesis
MYAKRVYLYQIYVMKNFLIDIYKIKDPYSGLGQFSLNFAGEIIRHRSSDMEIDFLVPTGNAILDLNKSENGVRLIKAGFQKRYFPLLNNRYTIWHSLHQFPSHKPGKRGAWILTIHDLNFLLEKSAVKSKAYLKRLQQNVDRADVITTISVYTKGIIEDNLNLRGKEVRVIYNGIARNEAAIISKPGFITEGKFFFSIGIFNRKKNFHTLIPLMNHFKDYKLVIAGNNRTAYGEEIINEIKRSGLTDRILLPGTINEGEKYWLYNNCDAFVFPSLAEGFGMPVIEAMKAGRPVFLSKYTSLPEIGGTVAFYFDNFDDSHMADKINSGLSAFEEQSNYFRTLIEMHTRRFTWEECINQFMKLYDEYK